MPKGNIAKLHKPVLLNEVLAAFNLNNFAPLKKPVRIIDATLGLGGHTEALVKSGADVLGIETDGEMLKLAIERLNLACPTPKINESWGSFKLVYGNFREIDEIAKHENFGNVSGILFDLGISSPQITSTERGFSFQHDRAILDMRMDKKGQSVLARDLLSLLSKRQLTELFNKVLNLKDSRILSEAVVKNRMIKNIRTVGDFKRIIERSIKSEKKLSLSTLPFLALRMAVNSEIENIEEALPKAFNILETKGRLAVISFHSEEESTIKDYFESISKRGLGSVITREPVVPTSFEIRKNIRARSAKLQVIEKI